MQASEVQTRHRDKSRELANAHKEDNDPNKVSERIRLAQEKVRDRLKPLLATQQPTSPTSPPSHDLRLDLTGATNVNDFNASQSMLSTTMGTHRFNASDKARELAEQRLRSIRETSYRTVAPGLAKRSTTRFDEEEDEDELDKLLDARSKFKKMGQAILEV